MLTTKKALEDLQKRNREWSYVKDGAKVRFYQSTRDTIKTALFDQGTPIENHTTFIMPDQLRFDLQVQATPRGYRIQVGEPPSCDYEVGSTPLTEEEQSEVVEKIIQELGLEPLTGS